MTTDVVLWTYLVLLIAGGLTGFLKAKSKISLGTSVGFAIPIALCALGILPLIVGTVLIGILGVFFGIRYAKGRKFMPAGLMTILSAAALVLLLML